MITKEAVYTVIADWPMRYQDANGVMYKAMRPDEVVYNLRGMGYKLSRMDRFDFERMGLKVVNARYIGGARPKRFCDVVVLEIVE